MTEKLKLEEGTKSRPAPQKPQQVIAQDGAIARKPPQAPVSQNTSNSSNNAHKKA